MSIPTIDIPASAPMIRLGSSDAASVYSPTSPMRNPIWAGVMAMDTSTTAIGHRRRKSSTDPAAAPKSIATGTGTPAAPANGNPSIAHSTDDTSARLPSSTALRHLAHHHGPVKASVWSSPVVVMTPAYGRAPPLFR